MYFSDIVKRSGRNLKASKIRTLLTAFAIAVGAFTLTLTLAAGNGVRTYTDKLVASNFDPAELLVGRDKEISNSGAPSTKPQEYDESVAGFNAGGPNSTLQVKRVTQADVEELRGLHYVEKVRENFQVNVRYITREGQKRYTTSAEAYNSAQKPELKAGTIPSEGDVTKGTILLPDTYLDVLGFKDANDALGKVVQVNIQQPFSLASLQSLLTGGQQITESSAETLKPEEKLVSLKVGAVTKRPATSLTFGLEPLRMNSEDARELYDFTAKGTSDYQKYIYVFARIKGGQDAGKLEDAKKNLESRGYFVQSSKDLQKAITQFVNILQIMVGVFGLITVVASIFGIVNTQYISVLERTREIGLMKSLGMRRRDVSRLFMLEATWIGFLGGLLGSLGGFALGTALNPWITKKLELGAGNALIEFNIIQMILLIVALMIVATVAGWLPSRKAAKLDPIVALRTE